MKKIFGAAPSDFCCVCCLPLGLCWWIFIVMGLKHFLQYFREKTLILDDFGVRKCPKKFFNSWTTRAIIISLLKRCKIIRPNNKNSVRKKSDQKRKIMWFFKLTEIITRTYWPYLSKFFNVKHQNGWHQYP